VQDRVAICGSTVCFSAAAVTVVVHVVVVVLLSDFIQLRITSSGSKTANIYVKTVQFIYGVRVTTWLEIQNCKNHN